MDIRYSNAVEKLKAKKSRSKSSRGSPGESSHDDRSFSFSSVSNGSGMTDTNSTSSPLGSKRAGSGIVGEATPGSSRNTSVVAGAVKSVGSTVVSLATSSAGINSAGHGAKTEREMEKIFKQIDLFQVATRMRASVEVKSRLYGAKRYPDCFIGHEAAQWMVDCGLCSDAQEAVYLGNLLVNAGLIFHVVDEVDFRADKKMFYQFHIDQVEFQVPQGAELEELKEKFSDYVTTHNRLYHLKEYKDVFVGSDAVDIMLQKGMAQSRKHAVAIGAALCEQGLFHHVCYDHTFKDEKLFYRYTSKN
ncbi:Phosphatidylinositol 3,4,5-trisphosphate-dependent Rac exchanger 1 protein [Porphyridium purpureum]|uniref:Phosphatidylinositol 3,4,5-trisphosphate-dependent Rac exchanger 1 protein n=1 Tax=Porphyridium purpureum TaxID=35688 RepID=A0A5J4Z718_PORPP|nr:Phosphatidylinositol 3,4,5-trisphosphate-dependent Rac exchanger 1 protein [Porphyridium purpureum]|eukprot:POR1231..scf295_1